MEILLVANWLTLQESSLIDFKLIFRRADGMALDPATAHVRQLKLARRSSSTFFALSSRVVLDPAQRDRVHFRIF